MENQTIGHILKMNVNERINFLNNLSTTTLLSILLDSSIDTNFNQLFLCVNDITKEELIKNKQITYKIFMAPKNKNKKALISLLAQNLKQQLLTNLDIIVDLPENVLNDIINSIEKKDNFLNNINIFLQKTNNSINNNILNTIHKTYHSDDNDMIKYLKTKFKISDTNINTILSMIKNKQINPLYLQLITSKKQLFIYIQFNVFFEDMEPTSKLSTISDDVLKNIKPKYIKKLFSIINIDENKNKDKAFVTAINLYLIFGYDNAMKILNNKFTFSTPSSIKRAAVAEFKNERKNYRMAHTDEFYSYELINIIYNSILNNNSNRINALFSYWTEKYRSEFFEYLKQNVLKINDKSNSILFLTDVIKKEIDIRETELETNFVSEYYNENSSKRNDLTCNELYEMFKNYDYSNTIFYNEEVMIDEELVSALLGNTKSDNDCLLRLIFNNQALDLNNNLCSIINNFDKLSSIISNYDGKISLYSITNIIEIMKLFIYELKPDEQDLTLYTLTKLVNSKEYCNNDENYIIKKAIDIHKRKKEKTFSTIPSVQGNYKDISFRTIPFDEEGIITCGIDSGTCFKIGGAGEEFLCYCLTNPHSIIIEINYHNKKYICPCIRNGNCIYCNGIDPKISNEIETNEIIEALIYCMKEICEKSNNKEKIELASLSNLHLGNFLDNKHLKKVQLEDNLFINGKFYADFYKDDIDNYIIYESKSATPQYYEPTFEYYQPRKAQFSYMPHYESKTDIDQINKLINLISYQNINYNFDTKKQKEHAKRNFQSKAVEDYTYIIGNNDWYIALDKNQNMEAICLPYDYRAKAEYLYAMTELFDRFNYINNVEGKRML